MSGRIWNLGVALGIFATSSCQLAVDFTRHHERAAGGDGGETHIDDTNSAGDGGRSSSGDTIRGGTGGAGTTAGGASTVEASGGASSLGTVGGAVGGTSSGTASTQSCIEPMRLCGEGCVDVNVDKNHCGSCGSLCEDYQFCERGTCLPVYSDTRVLLTAGDSVDVVAAAALSTKEHGDLLLQVRLVDSSIVFSSKGMPVSSAVSWGGEGAGFARYTADGTLVWGRDAKYMCDGSPLRFTVTKSGEIAIPFVRTDPQTGPVPPTSHYWLGKYDGNTAALIWEVMYESGDAQKVAYRSAQNDFITVGRPPRDGDPAPGSVCRVVDSGAQGRVTCLSAPNVAEDILAGGDGSTVWLSGYGGGTLNPWGSKSWNNPGNPNRQRGDFVIIGANDDGSSIGPWFTEGDWAVDVTNVVMTPDDSMVFSASTFGYTTFNGGQAFAEGAGAVLVKVTRTGKIAWRTVLAAKPEFVENAPGGRIAVVDYLPFENSDLPVQLSLFSGDTGALLSSFSFGRRRPAGASTIIASGTANLYVLGNVRAAADFHPGKAEDLQGAEPGVFISRFRF
ncbi:MAG: hypothetical protein QM784_02135 [Polyangiaceae bacterium]